MGHGTGDNRIVAIKTVDLRGLRRKNMMGAIIPALKHRIPLELRS